MAEGPAASVQEPAGRPGLRGEGGRDLVIGIGNSLRGDDGVGWWLADRAERLRPAPRVLAVQQLTPELCGVLAEAGRVLFIDACLVAPAVAGRRRASPAGSPLEGTGPALMPLGPASGSGEAGALSHRLEPPQLLAITALLHGRVPPAMQLLVPAFDLAHREGLSAPQRRLLPRAEALLRRWWAGRQARVPHA